MASYVRPMLALPTPKDRLPKKTFTVLSYNVLAQHLINRTWYSYASAGALKWNTRKANLRTELSQLNADVVCLQECSELYPFLLFFVVAFYIYICVCALFPLIYERKTFWERTMHDLGYNSYYKQREGKQDGCAVFFKRDL
jgi:mRNA deadenylase 3'-5' endonuclease subunit Ccr4